MVMVDMTNPDRTASLRADKLGVQGIPLFVAVDTESGRVSRQVGASDASAFSTWLKRAGGSS